MFTQLPTVHRSLERKRRQINYCCLMCKHVHFSPNVVISVQCPSIIMLSTVKRKKDTNSTNNVTMITRTSNYSNPIKGFEVEIRNGQFGSTQYSRHAPTLLTPTWFSMSHRLWLRLLVFNAMTTMTSTRKSQHYRFCNTDAGRLLIKNR